MVAGEFYRRLPHVEKKLQNVDSRHRIICPMGIALILNAFNVLDWVAFYAFITIYP
jgi:hypothetical protein